MSALNGIFVSSQILRGLAMTECLHIMQTGDLISMPASADFAGSQFALILPP
jgi:hypothetical protein